MTQPDTQVAVTRAQRRTRRHAGLALGVLLATSLAVYLLPGAMRERISLSTAYVALALLAATLAFGPLNVLRRQPNPVSFDLRRDVGIWAAVLSMVHTAVGMTVHFKGQTLVYFLAQPNVRSVMGLRADPFGITNWVGLIAAIILLGLGAISNDVSLRTLGTARWRFLQRWAYLAVAMTVAHGAIYQVLEKQRAPLVAIFLLVSATLLTLQLAGRHRFRARQFARASLESTSAARADVSELH